MYVSTGLVPSCSWSCSYSETLQAFWAPGDTGVVFVGWWHEPFRLGLKYCPNRRYEINQNQIWPLRNQDNSPVRLIGQYCKFYSLPFLCQVLIVLCGSYWW